MADANRPSPAERVARGLPFLVALSGGAALVYESLWMRSFGLIFGNTTDAVAMVLAVFMGGLALGSAIAARRRSADPLRLYALVEMSTGVAALATLPLLRLLPWAYGALAGRLGLSGPLELGGRAALATAILLVPTVLLGTTVPLAVEFLARAGQPVRASFGRLYLLNTLGGAAGVTIAPFALVPLLGVRGTLVAAATASLLAGGVALGWRRDIGLPPALPDGERPLETEPGPGLRDDEPVSPRALAAALAAASGAATFGVEVLWTRSYALVIGSSVYAFNLMLLAVLLGIAGGAALYARVRPRIRRPMRAVGGLFAGAGLAILAGQWAIGGLPIVSLALMKVLPVSFTAHQLAGLGMCLLTMLPVTLVLGTTFPLLLHLADRGRSAQEASGRLYAWNTAGAIAGALGADLVLVPRLGIQPPYLVYAALLLAGGIWALAEARPWPSLARRLVPAALVIVLVLVSPGWKPWDPVLMSAGVHRYGLEWRDRVPSALALASWLREQQELVFYREGKEAVVAVSKTAGGRHFLSVNGKTDAGSGDEDVVTQRFIAHVPMLLHPSPRHVLVIGWGAGATAASAALYPAVETLECVEIEPAVYEAASFFPRQNGALVRDPRFRITFGDGRNRLLRGREQWDVVVSEPSNPWISGVSNLFTREFYEEVRARLAPGGVFGQWFHYYNLTGPDVKVEVRTFLAVFPHASLWLVPPVVSEDGSRKLGADMLLVGSERARALDWDRLQESMGDTPAGRDLRATHAVDDALALVASWTMGRAEMKAWSEDEKAFPGGTPLNTDDHPYIEFVAPRRNVMAPIDAARAASAQHAAMSAAAGDSREAVFGLLPPNPEPDRVAQLYRELARRYARAEQKQRAYAALDKAIDALPDDALAQVQTAELLLESGRQVEALGRLSIAVRLDPDDVHAWDLLEEIASDRRDYPLVEKANRAILRREPSNVDAWLRLAAALARQSQWGEAEEALVWARRLDPDAPIDAELERYIRSRAKRERTARR